MSQVTSLLPCDWMLTLLVSICPPGFKLKHFLRDEESLSSFLQRNASFPEDAVQQVLEATVHLEQVSSLAAPTAVDIVEAEPFTFCVLAPSGAPQRFWSSPAGHVSQGGGTAEAGGLCGDLGFTGVCAGAGSPVCGPSRLVKPG